VKLRIVTWNINSIRLRAPLLARLAELWAPDVLCLQETKVEDSRFPHALAESLGYRHRLVHGGKAYNGVAILSRLPLAECERLSFGGLADHRHLSCRLCGDIELHNLYVPAGGDLPDPEQNPKFRHKLELLDTFTAYFAAREDVDARLLLVGDLNIAPLAADVWNHRALLKVVSHTPVEVERLMRLMQAFRFWDTVRLRRPPPERLYTWWSYRARDWARSDRGRRLDHIWIAPALLPAFKDSGILREARGWPRPSDHVPVLAEFEIGD